MKEQTTKPTPKISLEGIQTVDIPVLPYGERRAVSKWALLYDHAAQLPEGKALSLPMEPELAKLARTALWNRARTHGFMLRVRYNNGVLYVWKETGKTAAMLRREREETHDHSTD